MLIVSPTMLTNLPIGKFARSLARRQQSCENNTLELSDQKNSSRHRASSACIAKLRMSTVTGERFRSQASILLGFLSRSRNIGVPGKY